MLKVANISKLYLLLCRPFYNDYSSHYNVPLPSMTYAGSRVLISCRSQRLSSSYFSSNGVGNLRLTLHSVQVFHQGRDDLHEELTHILALKKG